MAGDAFLTLGIAAAFILGTIALMLGGYFTARALIGRADDGETRDLAGSIIFRVAALHGLILALVFAQQMLEYHELERETVAEADALANIYFNLERHGNAAPALQEMVRSYAESAIETEWVSLGRGDGLLGTVWLHWDAVFRGVLDLPAHTPRQASLRDAMLDDIRAISEARDRRVTHADQKLSVMFWTAAIAGIVLVSFAYFSFHPTRLSLILLSVFAGYTGLIMFLIYSFSNPFIAPGALQPEALRGALVEFG
ncbi:MAG: hypothetical protein AAGH83_10875 [Pseudomonadota bacterium]